MLIVALGLSSEYSEVSGFMKLTYTGHPGLQLLVCFWCVLLFN